LGVGQLNEMICIYCLEDKPKSGFINGEHVIPRSLGIYKKNLVLHNIVCDDCNKYFGDSLENHLARDSHAGIARYRFGIRPKRSPKYSRMVFNIERGHELEGLFVEPSYPFGGRENDIEIVDQVKLFHKGENKYHAFLLVKVPNKEELEKLGYDLVEHEIRVYGNIEDIVAQLKTRGIELNTIVKTGPITRPDAPIPVKVVGRIDRTIARAISKICFNYFAYFFRHFLLQPDFNGIRKFIRFDYGDLDDYFLVSNKPLNVTDLRTRKIIFPGHIIFIERLGDAIVGNISLFSAIARLSYRITLCDRYSGLWFPLKMGSYFDPKYKIITPLHPLKSIR